ncbi:MAG: hypothetical protein ACT4QC_03965 [Planctomycetaceae bacterium]
MTINSTRSAVFYLAAVFSIGLACGAVGGYALGYRANVELPTQPKLEAFLVNGLKADLGLSRAQVREIRPMVQETVREVWTLREQMVAETHVPFERLQKRMGPVLNDKQRATVSETMRRAFQKYRVEGDDGPDTNQ